MTTFMGLNDFIYTLPNCDKSESEDLHCFLVSGKLAGLDGLVKRAELHGFYSCYVEDNFSMCRQWFYLASRLREECCKFSNGWSMEFPDPLIFALLSDCAPLIGRYGNLSTIAKPHLELPSFNEAALRPSRHDFRYMVHYLQALIRRDWTCAGNIEICVRRSFKKMSAVDLEWFSVGAALRDSNKDEIIELIYKLLKPGVHKARNKERFRELSGQVWSHHPVMFTKLAWMHGLEIEIDSPLVPMALMPIRPLEHYDDVYDFLKPGYVPVVEKPKKSFLDRVFRR
ncbi:Imm49 family immunity protein [Amphibiibacter pelophylacis]|uniref:Imm49 family immunity protein n=1 Tax=Amphibiibacter pelophylacis TaxID=1799477 RepID=A0ACC6P4M8_9BURK